jgi:fructose-specific phosphotransferase system IIC component
MKLFRKWCCEVIVNQFKAFPKKLGAAFLSGLITGLITGVLLRVIMGIVAFVFPETARGLTLSGVIALLIVGLGFCLVNSIWFS